MYKKLIKIFTATLLLLISCCVLSACEEEHNHSYLDEIISPTCTQMGYTKHTCSCGYAYTDNFTNSIEHDIDEDGKCKNCSYQIQQDPNHKHEFKQVITAPSCEESGYLLSKCDCGEIESKTLFSNPLTHSFENYVYNNNATCEKNGTETATCSRDNCNKTNTRVKANTKLDHNFVNYIYNNNATCQEDGTETATCSRNNCNITDTRVKSNSKTSHQNDSGKCKFCDYYFDSSNYLKYVKVSYDNAVGYAVYSYTGKDTGAYVNIEIPAYYQATGDKTPLPVIAINANAFNPYKNQGILSIKSIKLNEGLIFIGNGAFNYTAIKEIVIPNSVIGGISGITKATFDVNGKQLANGELSCYPESQGLYNTFSNCSKLERVVIGDGVKTLESYVFSNCSNLKEVILGNGLKEIKPRAFYLIRSLEYLIIPASVNKIFEGTISSNSVQVAIINMLPAKCTTPIFMNITKAEYDTLLVEPRTRDAQGNILDPLPTDSIGLVKGWSGDSLLYFKGEWHYDEDGKPTPN